MAFVLLHRLPVILQKQVLSALETVLLFVVMDFAPEVLPTELQKQPRIVPRIVSLLVVMVFVLQSQSVELQKQRKIALRIVSLLVAMEFVKLPQYLVRPRVIQLVVRIALLFVATGFVQPYLHLVRLQKQFRHAKVTVIQRVETSYAQHRPLPVKQRKMLQTVLQTVRQNAAMGTATLEYNSQRSQREIVLMIAHQFVVMVYVLQNHWLAI